MFYPAVLGHAGVRAPVEKERKPKTEETEVVAGVIVPDYAMMSEIRFYVCIQRWDKKQKRTKKTYIPTGNNIEDPL
jgi:hypothetical protein